MAVSNLYVTPAMFVAHPTYLDLNDLRTGDTQQIDQTAELTNVLQMASTWADSHVEQPFAAHEVTEHTNLRPDRRGRLHIHAKHNPVRALTTLAYGTSIGTMTTITSPTYRVEDEDRHIVVELSGGNATWSGSLQFGPPVGYDLYVDATYIAGYANTTLAGSFDANAISVTVTDPLGIYPGDTLRLWDPGFEEAVTVAATYVPGSTTVPLAAGLLNAHAASAPITAVPSDVILAVVNYAVSALMRPDTGKEDDYPDARVTSSTRSSDPRQDGSGLVAEAKRLLRIYRRIR